MTKQRIRTAIVTSILLVLIGCSSEELSETKTGAFEQKYWVEDYVTQVKFPWAMTWLPDGTLLLTERLGKIKVVRNGSIVADLEGVPERTAIETVVDLAIHHRPSSNPPI